MLHNTEEAVSICRYPVLNPFSSILSLSCRQFLLSVILITIAVLFAFGAAMRAKKPVTYNFISTALASAILLINVFIPHLLLAIYIRDYTPGLLTAVLLNLPASLAVLNKNKRLYPNHRQMYLHIAGGLLSGYAFFALTLRIITLVV